MNPLALIIVACLIFMCSYLLFGRWLARRVRIDSTRETPAHTCEDGIDYVPTPSFIVFGQHFSALATAGVIAGPIAAAEFGWLPVAVCILVGGIFFGAVHDFGALFVSLRTKGALVIAGMSDTIDETTKRLICVFAYLMLLVVIATFMSFAAHLLQVSDAQDGALNHLHARVACILAFLVVASVVWGALTRSRIRAQLLCLAPAVAIGIVVVIAVVVAGFCAGDLFSFDTSIWILALGIYVFVSAVAPVWIVNQPRSFLSALLLGGVMCMALVGIVGSSLAGTLGSFDIPLWSGFFAPSDAFNAQTGQLFLDEAGKPIPNAVAQGGFLFPTLFVLVSSAALSGFHSLVASGITSKQLSSQRHAFPVTFGAGALVCVLALVALCAVGFVWNDYAAGAYTSPVEVFADGISGIFALVPGFQGAKEVAFTLCVLAFSTLCVSTLDTSTRLARLVFQEFWRPSACTAVADMREHSDECAGEQVSENAGAISCETSCENVPAVETASETAAESLRDTPTNARAAHGIRKLLANKYVATFITVVLGTTLGTNGSAVVWPFLGVANLLLAACVLLAVSAWFARAHKRCTLLRILRAIVLLIAICSLGFTIVQTSMGLFLGEEVVANVVQLALACVLLILAFFIAAKSRKVVLLYGDYCE